jgi:mRNA-degrading endonuclease RelE of RelBE toxin-antitoxin system
VSFKIVPTPSFERELKKLTKRYPSLKQDISTLSKELLQNPRLGTSLGSECYKIRMAISSKGKGKSGGARVITYLQIINEVIFLVAVYDKSEMQNIAITDIQERVKRIQDHAREQ